MVPHTFMTGLPSPVKPFYKRHHRQTHPKVISNPVKLTVKMSCHRDQVGFLEKNVLVTMMLEVGTTMKRPGGH